MGGFRDTLGGSLLDLGGSLLNNYLQNKENRRAEDRDRRFQEYMWNKQNEYNLPINQISRLRQAGLNPQLALGDVNTVASASLGGQSSNSIPSVGPGLDNLNILSKANMVADTKLQEEKARTEKVAQSQMQAQTSNTKEQTKFLSSQIKNIDADTKLKLLNYQLEDVKRQSGIVGNDILSNVSRSIYGTGKKAVDGFAAYGKHLFKNFKMSFENKKKEFQGSQFYKDINNK